MLTFYFWIQCHIIPNNFYLHLIYIYIYIYVPSRPRTWTKGQSQRVKGPLVGPKEESQQIDRLRHRRVNALPIGSVALLRRRLRKASPG